MGTAVLKSEIESSIESKLGAPVFFFREKPIPETIPTGIAEIDANCGGLERGAINEITGPRSSGRTTLLHSILAGATQRRETCALIDTSDSFDPCSATAAGVDLRQLLWVRCATNKCPAHKSPDRNNNALRVADLLLQAGGWGVIVLDLGDIDPKDARRIPLNAWHRFRLAVENRPTVFLVIGQEPYAASCSARVLETRKRSARWQGRLFRGAVFEALRQKPFSRAGVCIAADLADCF
jgi:recombination protein RecA